MRTFNIPPGSGLVEPHAPPPAEASTEVGVDLVAEEQSEVQHSLESLAVLFLYAVTIVFALIGAGAVFACLAP